MDCILIRPPFNHTGYDQEVQESLGTAYLLAALREKGYSTALLDGELQDLTSEQIASALTTMQPAVIGFSIMSEYTLNSVYDISQYLDQSESWKPHLTAGGYLPSFFPERIFSEIPFLDSIVQYEGEIILPELVQNTLAGRPLSTRGITIKDINNTVKRTAPSDYITDLDLLPMPHRDEYRQIIKKGFPATISSSRGCSGSCSFCAISNFYKRSCRKPLRMRSPENVISEISYLNKIYGSKIFHFIDDDFIGNSKSGYDRAKSLAALIKERCPDIIFYFECRPDLVDKKLFSDLKNAGLAGVFVGIDSAVDKTRNLYNKNCSIETVEEALKVLRNFDIKVDTGFIPFHPEVTFAEIAKEYNFLFRHNLDNLQTLLNRLYCTGESALSQSLLAKGLLKDEGTLELTYEFKDSRVSLFYEIASVALKPLFPIWYELYRKEYTARNKAFLSGNYSKSLPEELNLQEANTEVRESVKNILSYIDDSSGQDMLSFTRTIKENLKISLEKIQGGKE